MPQHSRRHTWPTSQTPPPIYARKIEPPTPLGWTADDDRWDDMFEALKEHAADLPNGRLQSPFPQNFPKKLNRWVQIQRTLHRKSKLPKDRIEALEAIPGFEWKGKRGRRTLWKENIQELLEIAKGQPDKKLPLRFPQRNRLTIWVSSQRRLYAEGKLEASKIKTLENIPGFKWKGKKSLPSMRPWNRRIDSLKEHALSQPDKRLPSRLKDVPADLRKWVFRQRTAYKKRRLSKDQIKTLEALPGFRWTR